MKILRALLLSLLLSLLIGLAIGTAIRMRLTRPVQYLGQELTPATHPFDIGHAGAPVFDPRHHEQQVG